ncbi:MAG: alpha/beta hydrolase [Clostridia bacterium]|nr:alpha/beta hydrolase [Clostridia bacterium]
MKTKKPLAIIHNSVSNALKPYEEKTKMGVAWVDNKIENHEVEDVYIKSNDGLNLHGLLIKHEKPKGILIECHGYRSTARRDLYISCFQYYNWGYDVLLNDQRTSEKSDGKYITFGSKESMDIVKWCEYVSNRYSDLPIILAGISMGASTVLLAADKLKEEHHVKLIIADSGFISAWNEVVYAIKHYFHLPGECFIHMINLWCMMLGRFSLKEKNTIDVLKNTKLPILFIHGENDDFVPVNNSVINYNEYKDKKELLIIPEANHGMGYLVDTEKYLNTIKKFIDKYVF